MCKMKRRLPFLCSRCHGFCEALLGLRAVSNIIFAACKPFSEFWGRYIINVFPVRRWWTRSQLDQLESVSRTSGLTQCSVVGIRVPGKACVVRYRESSLHATLHEHHAYSVQVNGGRTRIPFSFTPARTAQISFFPQPQRVKTFS